MGFKCFVKSLRILKLKCSPTIGGNTIDVTMSDFHLFSFFLVRFSFYLFFFGRIYS